MDGDIYHPNSSHTNGGKVTSSERPRVDSLALALVPSSIVVKAKAVLNGGAGGSIAGSIGIAPAVIVDRKMSFAGVDDGFVFAFCLHALVFVPVPLSLGRRRFPLPSRDTAAGESKLDRCKCSFVVELVGAVKDGSCFSPSAGTDEVLSTVVLLLETGIIFAVADPPSR